MSPRSANLARPTCFVLTIDSPEQAEGSRSAGWNVSEACNLEAALMHALGDEALFVPGGQGVLTDACTAWRGTGLEPCRAITCLQAGLTADQAACMT